MSRSQREKGKRGERAAAKAVSSALRVGARRGVQYKGGPASADIEVAVDGVHWEVKFVERESIRAWMRQATADAGDKIPVVLSKRSREPWLVSLPLERLYELCARLETAVDQAVSPLGPGEFSADLSGSLLPPASEDDAGDARVLSVRRRRGARGDRSQLRAEP